jgi:CheY-like chemotaxis protein
MQKQQILWADDEIDLLKAHIMFLQAKNYEVTPVNSGADAVEACENGHFDLVFLDENMPGMSGLETLGQIKKLHPHLPVVMVTKSEEEDLMEEAIGSHIADYLIKPVNSKQILLSVKKILHKNRIVTEKTNSNYQQDFRKISMSFMDDMNAEEWADVYKKLVYWELKIEGTEDKSMKDVLDMQKSEANVNFVRFINENYAYWLNDAPADDRPLMSHQLMKEKVFPLLVEEEEQPLFFILLDNLRYDQWKILETIIAPYFKIKEESSYYSILPTTTAYARNAIFSGMMPSQMEKKHPDLWLGDLDDGGKNNFEKQFLEHQLKRTLAKDVKMSYTKIIKSHQGKNALDNFNNLLNNDFNVLVYNFVDMLSHARTDTAIIKELVHDEATYRSVTRSWFEHSPFFEMIKKIAQSGSRLVITTDHGTIRTKNPYKIVGDRETNTNLRYKQGKNLNYKEKNVVVAKKPEDFFLPSPHISTSYVFATEDYFFAYPNNYNHYVKYYKDTFQHGGVSMEEIIIPLVILEPK